MFLVLIAHFASSTAMADVVTSFDPITKTIEVDFTDLPPYAQITLQGVTGLFWCSCLHPDNPATIAGTGFTVNGPDLDMQYEGGLPPSTNYITYTVSDEFDVVGFELVEWIQVTDVNGGQFRLTAERPIVVPEPTLPMGLFSSIGLALGCRPRWKSSHRKDPRPPSWHRRDDYS